MIDFPSFPCYIVNRKRQQAQETDIAGTLIALLLFANERKKLKNA